jgi:hypothetical protein
MHGAVARAGHEEIAARGMCAGGSILGNKGRDALVPGVHRFIRSPRQNIPSVGAAGNSGQRIVLPDFRVRQLTRFHSSALNHQPFFSMIQNTSPDPDMESKGTIFCWKKICLDATTLPMGCLSTILGTCTFYRVYPKGSVQ